MNRMRVWIVFGCCAVLLTVAVQGQTTKQKPGLWEVTTSMTMAGMPQMPQMPPGAQMPPGMKMPASPFAPHTNQICVTQAMIDKYGSPYTNPPQGDCQLTDVSVKSDGMTAKIACTGTMAATGTVKTTFVDADNAKGSVHLTGTMQTNQGGSRPVDMTMEWTSAYKGADCGNVKPAPMPSGN